MDLSLIVVTDRRQARMPLVDVIAAALDGGARTVLLREKDLPREERTVLASRLRGLGACVIVAGPDPLDGNAIHLAAADPFPSWAVPHSSADAPLAHRGAKAASGGLVVGRSCHTVAEVMALTGETYCTLSPIFASASKPDYGPALGVGVLGVRGGIVALGGVETRERADACREAGAAGIAVMGAVMRAHDPATVVKGLLP